MYFYAKNTLFYIIKGNGIVNALLEKNIIIETTEYSRNQIFAFEKYIDLFLNKKLISRKIEKIWDIKMYITKNLNDLWYNFLICKTICDEFGILI